MKKIVSIGRGGVGKTTLIGLLAKYFIGKGTVLLIDADPDQSLAQAVGLDLEGQKVRTVSDILFDVKQGTINDGLKAFTLGEKIDYLINQAGLYEGEHFDFLGIGTKWTDGCYCQPNNILKGLMEKLERNYDYVLIDSPAGLEHLNRRITSSVDVIFAILDPSQKAFDNAKRSYKLVHDIRIKFQKFYLVANYRFPEQLLDTIETKTGLECMGKLAYDKEAEESNLEGRGLLDIREDSPVFSSVLKILERSGLLKD